MSNITTKNVEEVRKMISAKKYINKPFLATNHDVVKVITDYDHFPYTRLYRGRYQSTRPIVIEREAGFRTRHDDCYKTNGYSNFNDNTPRVCFQNACSVVFPCNPFVSSDHSLKDRLYPTKECLNIYQ